MKPVNAPPTDDDAPLDPVEQGIVKALVSIIGDRIRAKRAAARREELATQQEQQNERTPLLGSSQERSTVDGNNDGNRVQSTRDPDVVNCADIRWTLDEPPPLIEQVDVLTLTDDELIHYTTGLQCEARWLRAALREALALLHRLTMQLERAQVRIEQLLAALRALRRRGREEPAR